MAENKRSGINNIGYALSKGAAAFGQGLTGTDYLSQFEDMEEARAKLQKQAKVREQESKIGSMLAGSDDPDIIPFAKALVDGQVSLKQVGDAYNIMTKKDKSKSDIESLNELLTGMGVMKNVPTVEPASKNPVTGEYVVTKATAGGVTVESPGGKATVDTESGLAKENVEIAKSRLVSTYNMDVIGPLMKDYMQLLADSNKQGGSGNALRKVGNRLAMSGIISGKAAEKYEKSSAIPGKKGDIILKMFPMLTQQIGKEGSIRLVTSVLDMIGVTVPDDGTPPALVREPAYQTMLSLAKMRKAIEGLNIKDFRLDDPDGEKVFAKEVARSVSRLDFTDEEQSAWEDLSKEIFEPWDSYYTSPSMRQNKDSNLKVTKSGIGFTYREVK